METNLNDNIKPEIVSRVLSKKLGTAVRSADYSMTRLHGGTLGDVKRVSGSCETADQTKVPFELVWKTQKKWARPGDPESWRREYDLYASDLGSRFSETLCWPECYAAELNGDETKLWMEYIGGVSGLALTVEMLEKAAYELGCFQGRLYAQPETLSSISCLSDIGYPEREHAQWHTQVYSYAFLCSEQCRIPEHVKKWLRKHPWCSEKSIEYHYLRSDDYDIPKHLKQMLIDIDDNREEIFQKMKRLPVVLCHRDFWVENIFFADGKIRLIDWDCAGFGPVGEDIASLIVDDTETENLHAYYRRLIPAYNDGISRYIDAPPVESKLIWEMMLLKFGYRLVQEHLFTTSDEARKETVSRLQTLYDMQDM